MCLKVHLRHLKYITGVCQEHIAPFSILRHILVFTFLESFQFCQDHRFLPNKPYKGLLRLPTTGRIVFIQQTILNDLKLQLPHRTDNLTTIELIDKQLCHTFIHQLVNAFANCFCFIGSAFSIYLNISGEKLGNPRKWSISPSVSVSPILKVPLSGKPIISPA